jgi:hypothetical protein
MSDLSHSTFPMHREAPSRMVAHYRSLRLTDIISQCLRLEQSPGGGCSYSLCSFLLPTGEPRFSATKRFRHPPHSHQWLTHLAATLRQALNNTSNQLGACHDRRARPMWTIPYSCPVSSLSARVANVVSKPNRSNGPAMPFSNG